MNDYYYRVSNILPNFMDMMYIVLNRLQLPRTEYSFDKVSEDIVVYDYNNKNNVCSYIKLYTIEYLTTLNMYYS